MKMFKYLPNALSLSRIPLSVALLWAAATERWELATVLLMVALVTDALDGWVAREFDAQSKFGGEVLEPLCDLVLSIAAIGGLYFGGAIDLWVPIALVVITALLQTSHATPYLWLKRHTFYLHPLFFLGVMLAAGGYYIILAYGDQVGPIAVYSAVWVFMFAFKYERIQEWLDGPPQTISS